MELHNHLLKEFEMKYLTMFDMGSSTDLLMILETLENSEGDLFLLEEVRFYVKEILDLKEYCSNSSMTRWIDVTDSDYHFDGISCQIVVERKDEPKFRKLCRKLDIIIRTTRHCTKK